MKWPSLPRTINSSNTITKTCKTSTWTRSTRPTTRHLKVCSLTTKGSFTQGPRRACWCMTPKRKTRSLIGSTAKSRSTRTLATTNCSPIPNKFLWADSLRQTKSSSTLSPKVNKAWASIKSTSDPSWRLLTAIAIMESNRCPII